MSNSFQPGVQECPHCLARVVIVSNGICPRCQKDARDRSSLNPDRMAVWIRQNDELPSLCHKCGLASTRLVTVKHTHSWEASAEVSKSRNLLGLLFGITIGWIWFFIIRDKGGAGSSRKFESVVIRLPQCAFCGAEPVEQVGASMEDGALKLVSHRVFVAEFNRVNNPQGEV